MSDLVTTTGPDALAFWQGLLAACRAQLQGKATKDQASMMFQGRQLQRYSIVEAMALHDRAQREVAKIEAAADPKANKIHVAFWR